MGSLGVSYQGISHMIWVMGCRGTGCRGYGPSLYRLLGCRLLGLRGGLMGYRMMRLVGFVYLVVGYRVVGCGGISRQYMGCSIGCRCTCCWVVGC